MFKSSLVPHRNKITDRESRSNHAGLASSERVESRGKCEPDTCEMEVGDGS